MACVRLASSNPGAAAGVCLCSCARGCIRFERTGHHFQRAFVWRAQNWTLVIRMVSFSFHALPSRAACPPAVLPSSWRARPVGLQLQLRSTHAAMHHVISKALRRDTALFP